MFKRTNPFVFGGPVDPEHFFGRVREVQSVLDQLTSHALGSVAIIGERRIGKTSLLHYVSARHEAPEPRHARKGSIVIHQDCGAISPFSVSGFWRAILRRLQRVLLQEELDAGLAKGVRRLLDQDTITTLDIQFLLDDLHDAGQALVLMLDEFEWCVRTDPEDEPSTRELLAGLRALINHAPRALSLIVATRRALNEVCRDVRFMGSPFYNNFVFVFLHLFSKDEAEELLERTLSGTGVQFSQEERSTIFRLAGTHPLLLQAAAALVFDAKSRPGHETHSPLDIREEFHALVKHQFEDFWRVTSSRGQRLLGHLASGHRERVQPMCRDWTHERENLIERGLVVKRGQTYELFSPVFAEWLAGNLYRLGGKELSGSPGTAATVFGTVFVSYCREDDTEKQELLKHLRVLQHAGYPIDVWSDDRIGGGEDWEKEIRSAMKRAKVAVLLISANFLDSEFILGEEIPTLLRRRETEGLIVIPVIGKDCAWRRVEWLRAINARPRSGNPVWRAGGVHADEELSTIAGEVADLLMRPV